MNKDKKMKKGRKLPNIAKSVEGKWYPFNGHFKIEQIKKDSELESSKQKKYRFTITFPSEARTGIYPKEIVLTGHEAVENSHSWACFWYEMREHDVPTTVQKLVEQLKDRDRIIKKLNDRNIALERHFSQTAFEEEQQRQRKEWLRVRCEGCFEEIDKKQSIEGADYVYLEEDVYHLDCAVDALNSVCLKCGAMWSEDLYDDEPTCPECGGKLMSPSKEVIRKGLQYNAIKHYLPEELQDRVILKTE